MMPLFFMCSELFIVTDFVPGKIMLFVLTFVSHG